MKKMKCILSFLLIFIMIVGIMPVVHAEDNITITGLDLPVNMTKSVTFYVKDIPEGFDKATVEIDNTYVRTITENGSTYYKVKLDPKDYLTPGTHEVKISAGDIVATKEVEFYYPTSNKNVITADMSGLASLSKDDGLTASEAVNATGLTYVVSQEATTGVTISRKSGLGNKDATDYALAFVGKTGNTKTTASYIRYTPSSKIEGGVVEIDFSFYRHGSTIRNLTVSAPITANYGYVSLIDHVKQSDVWYHVRFLMNLSEKTYSFEVDNGGGVLSTGNGVLDKEDVSMSTFYIQMSPANDNSAFVAIDDLTINAYVPVTKEVEITSPVNGEEIEGSAALNVEALAPRADSVVLYVDGVAEETVASDGSGNYAFSIDAAYGLKDIRVVAFSGVTPIGADSVNINWKGQSDSNLTTATNGNFQNFNTMEAYNAVSDTTTLNAFKDAFGWRVNVNASNQLTLSRTAGHTGQSGDYAPLFQYPSASAANGNNYRVILDGANPGNETAGGRLIYDFWFKMNTKDSMCLYSVPLWHDQIYFITAGTLTGTNYTINPGTWYHFNMMLDRDAADEEGKGLWYVKIGDTLVVNGVRQGTNQYMTNNTVIFSLTHNGSSSATTAGIALDDVRIHMERDLPYIESTTYMQDDKVTSAANTIPALAESVSISLNKALNVTDDDVELYIDGVIAEHDGVSVSNKVVTVNLPKLSASSDVKVVLKNTIDGLYADLSAYFNVTDENGFYAKTINYNISADVASAVVHSIAPDAVAANAYVASYNDGLMTKVSVNSLTIGQGKHFTAITKSESFDSDTVKIMLWDANMKPLVSAVSNEYK